MNSQELRALQEAYSQVYAPQELDESGLSQDTIQRAVIARQKRNDAALARDTPEGDDEFTRGFAKVKRSKSQLEINKKFAREGPTVHGEAVDLYDIILSHLLDEGYADTEQAAEAIMVNMSEDWRESIVEEVLDERNRGEEGMSDREVSRRRNLGGNTRSKVSSSSLGDHGPQGAIQKFHNVKSKQRQAIHKTARGVRGDTGESGGKGRYEANKDHKDGYPSITKRGQGPS